MAATPSSTDPPLKNHPARENRSRRGGRIQRRTRRRRAEVRECVSAGVREFTDGRAECESTRVREYESTRVREYWCASDGLRAASAAPPPGSLNLAHLPQKNLGEVGVADGAKARRRGSHCVRGGPPRPLPARSSRRGENSIALRNGASHLPPPRSLWGRAGGGGRLPLAPRLPEHSNARAVYPLSRAVCGRGQARNEPGEGPG